MMKTYAYIWLGEIAQVIHPEFYPQDSLEGVEPPYKEGEYIPLDRRFSEGFRSTCVDITGLDPAPQEGWVATPDGESWSFSPYVAPKPTAAEILASQGAKLVALKTVANAQKIALTNRIGELSEAIEYEVATPEEVSELPLRVAQRKAWGLHSIDLGRVTSQEGWPPNVVWPIAPPEGMDLTTSATASADI